MKAIILLLPLSCTVAAMGAEAEIDAGSDAPAVTVEAAVEAEAAPACDPCRDCPPDELGRARYCDDKGVCRLNQVCIAPGPVWDAGDPRCAPWQAIGTGDACTGVLGWAYDGSRCYRVVGCACEGTDCGHLYLDPLPCGLDHSACPRDSDAGL